MINELLTASVPPQADRIELFNPTPSPVNVGGWFLTDDHGIPEKYRIPDGTVIAAGAFAVFEESQFNANPGAPGSFSLSSRGESLYLFSGDAGTNLTGYSHGLIFDAAETNVTFGRHLDSLGGEHFPAQITPTFGSANSGPRIGPIVISEIHYHPAPGGDEFIELANVTESAVPLFDSLAPDNTWRLDGIDFAFPTNSILSPRALMLLVRTNPSVFRIEHNIPAGVTILGPFSGLLQDSGERLTLKRPAPTDTNGPAYITVDEVRYNDRAPWPPSADGLGLSLQRILVTAYGDDPANWEAASPTPGRLQSSADSDGDGMSDDWELAHGTNPFLADATGDPDNDGAPNLDEYLAGTDPQSANSALKLTASMLTVGSVRLQFSTVAGHGYSLQYKTSLNAGAWLKLQDFPAEAADRTIVVQDSPGTIRFYRIVTPPQP